MSKKLSQKTQEASVAHPEAKGLILLSFCLIGFLSLGSFICGFPSKNLLGFFGYYLSLSLLYLFGLSSYLIMTYLTWMGWRLLTTEKIPLISIRTFYFSLVVVSISILLTLLVDQKGLTNPILISHIFSEVYYIKTPYIMKVERYYLGGVPFYYLFKDIPTYNLLNLLNPVGVFCTFFITAFVSFILMTEISLMNFFRSCSKTYQGVAKFFKTVKKNVQPLPFSKPSKPSDLAKEKAVFSAKTTDYPSSENSFQKPLIKPSETYKASRPISQLPSMSQPIDNSIATFEEEDCEMDQTAEDEIQPFPNRSFQTQNNLKQTKPLEEIQKPSGQNVSLPLQEKKLPIKTFPNYKMPPVNLLTNAKKIDKPTLKRDLRKQAEILEETLASFGIEAKVGQINCGPTITSFEVHPAIGVKVQKIKALEHDIALNLQAKSIRIIAPIPGKAAVGVEIPSLYPQEVGFKEMLARYQQQRRKFKIPILLGKTVAGEDVVCDLTKMPHCIIAGATGSGKSVCINTIVMSILMNAKPDEIKLLLVDPKKVELSAYTQLPHMIAPIITEPQGAYAALHWLVKEMQERYEILKQLSLRNITSFNERTIDQAVESALTIQIPEKMFYIVAIIDEFADLMMTSSTDLETPIARIAQMARAVGIHLILATQRPSREVITGLIKANFPTRISFKVSSRINSQIILDENGAESLLGNGDLLFMPPGSSQLIRAQGAFICDDDINKIVDFHCKQDSTQYLIKSFDQMPKSNFGGSDSSENHKDSLYQKALAVVVTSRNASTTFLQRKLKIGYARAASLIDELEENKVIGIQEGTRPRKILLSSSSIGELPLDLEE